jgi:hypothetical protein
LPAILAVEAKPNLAEVSEDLKFMGIKKALTRRALKKM